VAQHADPRVPGRLGKIWIVGDDFGHLVKVIPSLAKLDVPPPPPAPVEVRRFAEGSGYAIEGEQLAWWSGRRMLANCPT
jgi:hypothetical protein